MRNRRASPAVAVAYLRASTDDQRLTPEAQRRDIARWAERERIAVVAWHLDKGISGGSAIDARPGLLAALADLETHRAGTLVVAKRDRLARDVLYALLIEREAARAGARVVSADGLGNGDDPGARLQRGIVDLFAEHERALIRARTRAALAAKHARGEWTGKPRFGYRVAGDGVHVEPDPHEQAVIAAVRQRRAEGQTLRAIVADLAAAGYRSRAGTPFGLTQVAKLARGT
jgi:DNA invertase Pin-like site-specific DNA recombinase